MLTDAYKITRGIWWSNIISNDDLSWKTKQENVNTGIKIRKYEWFSHILRKSIDVSSHFVLEWNLQENKIQH